MYEERQAVLLEKKETAEHQSDEATANSEKLASKLRKAHDQLTKLEAEIKVLEALSHYHKHHLKSSFKTCLSCTYSL